MAQNIDICAGKKGNEENNFGRTKANSRCQETIKYAADKKQKRSHNTAIST